MTAPATSATTPVNRLGRLEDPDGDFPYYNGEPVGLTGAQWGFVLGAVAAGFAALVVPMRWLGGPASLVVPAVLFAAIPLAALAHVAPGHWKAIFGRVGWRELRLMLGFALLNLVVSLGVGSIVAALADVKSNAAVAQLAAMGTTERLAFFAKTLPQLLGEELITVLPFLALLEALTRGLGIGRRSAIIGAWVTTSLLFGLIHLPTYDWNLVQCIVIIGSARMMLTLPWILTKNLWVSTGAHIVNDWLLFGATLAGAALVGKA